MSAYDDSIDKELHLYFLTQIIDDPISPSYEFFEHITNDKIISESMSLTTGILESNQFQLGSYVIPEMQLQILYTGNRYKEKFVRVWINDKPTEQIQNPQKHGLIFGKVYKEVISADRKVLTLTIRNCFYDAFNQQISWNDTFFKYEEGYYDLISASVFYESLLKHTYGYALGVVNERFLNTLDISGEIDLETSKIRKSPNASDLDIYKLDEDKTISLSQAWKFWGEYLGVHFKISMPNYSDFDIESSSVRVGNDINIGIIKIDDVEILYPNNDIFPFGEEQIKRLPGVRSSNLQNNIYDIPYYFSLQFDEFINTSYNIIDYGEQFNHYQKKKSGYYNKNIIYYIQDGNLLFNRIPLWYLENYIIVKTGISEYLFNSKYVYAILDTMWAYIDCGENIIFSTTEDNSTSFAMPILSCRINGINALIATYKSTATTDES